MDIIWEAEKSGAMIELDKSSIDALAMILAYQSSYSYKKRTTLLVYTNRVVLG